MSAIILQLFTVCLVLLSVSSNKADDIYEKCMKKTDSSQGMAKMWKCVYGDAGILKADDTLDRSKFKELFGNVEGAMDRFDKCLPSFTKAEGDVGNKLVQLQKCLKETE